MPLERASIFVFLRSLVDRLYIQHGDFLSAFVVFLAFILSVEGEYSTRNAETIGTIFLLQQM